MVTEVVVASDTEPASWDRKGLHDQFMTIMADLSRGDLTFPPPFDLAASAALASNTDMGTLALRLFELVAARDCAYEVTVTALSTAGDTPPLRREIINTSVASTSLLFQVLDGLMDELEARLPAEQPAD